MTSIAPSSTTTLVHFPFPPHYSFPPFFTLQPIPTTRSSQLLSWSSLIISYCRFNRLFKLDLNDALSTPLFHNAQLNRRLNAHDARIVLTWMASKDGGERVEWITEGKGDEGREARCWVYWRRPEEWGQLVYDWVDGTAQKGTVLTLYELVQGDATSGQDFHAMPMELLQKSLQTLVRKGKAMIFTGSGQDDAQGVKFL